MSWGNLTEEKVALYLREILEALHYLHGWQIAHLDLKVKMFVLAEISASHLVNEIQVQGSKLPFLQPENIVVEHASSQPVIKLTDFGDAVQLSPASSYIHPLLGSPEFSAPELVLGQPASLMSDIWSLGLLHTIASDGIMIRLRKLVKHRHLISVSSWHLLIQRDDSLIHMTNLTGLMAGLQGW